MVVQYFYASESKDGKNVENGIFKATNSTNHVLALEELRKDLLDRNGKVYFITAFNTL